ncbi:MAG: alpha/beta hydrolase [Vicinamibacterales bacterium]
MRTSDHFTAASGSRIFHEVAGEGPSVLAIHGVGGGAFFFRGLAQRLGGRYRVLAVDLPGTGRSEAGPGMFSLAGWVADLGELVAARMNPPVAIIGHSIGTIVALEAWAAWPERISRLVFVGGIPEPTEAGRLRLGARAEALRRGSLAGLGETVSAGNFAPETVASRPEVVGLFERAFEGQVLSSYVRSLEILLSASATRIVSTVTVPCLSISGAADLYAPPDVVTAFVAALTHAPHSMAILPNVGHLPFFEAPEEFARLVGRFLEEPREPGA